MFTLQEFLSNFPTDDPVQCLQVFPPDSLVVSDESSDLQEVLVYGALDLITNWGPVLPYGNEGFNVRSTNDLVEGGVSVFQVFWPTCEGSSSPSVYLLTDSYSPG